MLRIKKISAINVHGYIPINLSFKNNLTFLTGSNGSGKTTALKLISAILKPNFEQLNQIQFDKVTLICWVDNETVKISISKNISPDRKNFLEWEILRSDRIKRYSIKSNVELSLKNEVYKSGALRLYSKNHEIIFSNDENQNLRESIRLEFVKSEFYSILNSFSSPILLGIDRKIIGNIHDIRNDRNRRYSIETGEISNPSFVDAQRAIMNYVSDKADIKKGLVEEFKSNIFKSLFKYVKYISQSSVFSKISDKDFIKKRDITISAIKRLELGDDIIIEVNEYFDKLKDVQKKLFVDNESDKTKKDQIIYEWYVNRPHLRRIENISEFAEDFQKKIDELDYPLTEITNIVNSFFIESNKRIRIGANGVINVEWSNKEISTKNLSSGEIQLIVIIIHLVFCEFEKDKTVFVIDEPELSLHISWQEKFVEAITKASPGTQFILATHSPAIISKLEYEKNCIYLSNF